VIPLFAYGTLRDPEYQAALFGRTYPTRPATLSGWRVVVGDGGYFTVVADPAACTAGDLVALDDPGLAIADGWEGAHYARLTVRAHDADGTPGDAWLYVCPTTSRDAPPPGATALHARADVLAAIRAYVAVR
jgi:gamma-glutamylcyclotransferase (GGCT)/AIG2-like uncharacterized protein YtfP